jgi:iron-sulfur cluster repair protein YtfE (RIC family)
MAMTAPKTRTRRASSETSAERSAAVKNEPRDENGAWTEETKGAGAKKRRAAPAKSTAKKRSAKGEHSTGTLVGVAAAGLAVGLAANVARKFAVQAPTALAGDWDQALSTEHRLTLKVFDALQATTGENTVKRGALLANLKHMLSKHAMEEENVIYPALREAGEVEAADELNKEHGYVKQYLYELTELPKNSVEFLPKVQKFRTDIEAHIREEETELFPRLKAKLSPEKNKELTAQMNKEGLKLA